MKLITQNDAGLYELTEEVYNEINTAVSSIEDLIEIICSYCEHHADYHKINRILTLVLYLKLECEKISDKF